MLATWPAHFRSAQSYTFHGGRLFVWGCGGSCAGIGRRGAESTPMLVLGDWVDSAIRRHVECSYPFECGGLLWGTEMEAARRIVESYPLPNRSSEPRRRIHFDPLEIHQADQQAQSRGLGVWGFYHSHPDQAALPSATDLEGAAYLHWSYLIVPVWKGRAGAFRSWNLQEDRESFCEEKIEIFTRSN